MKHESSDAKTVVWLTPPGLIDALGGADSFDFDPCAAPAPQPWPTARRMNTRLDGNGLQMRWHGRVWLNPPYTASEIGRWLARMAGHNRGTSLIFARTETENFRRWVWERASGLLFLYGRLTFHRPDGSLPSGNAGAPTVLCAYGQEDLDRLAASGLDGALVPLRFARVMAVGHDASWTDVMLGWIREQRGPVSVSEAYRHFARHPKARRNPNWRAKVRQKLAEVAERVGPALYEAAA